MGWPAFPVVTTRILIDTFLIGFYKPAAEHGKNGVEIQLLNVFICTKFFQNNSETGMVSAFWGDSLIKPTNLGGDLG